MVERDQMGLGSKDRKESCSFLKKRTKKLLSVSGGSEPT
jgi:hypothetical protein